MQHSNPLNFILTKTAAQLLEVTPHAVRAMERRGALPAVRVDGTRLFDRTVVERLAAQRRAAREDRVA